MKEFDVVIVGAGPAGSHCARLLTKSGYKILLIEQCEDFYQNNFSSAATPLETLQQFDLPQDVVASFWQKIKIVTSHLEQDWHSQKILGAVFDFAKLREFLAQDVKKNGGEVWLGHRYLKYCQEKDKTLVEIKPKNGDRITVSTKILVDATGYARAVMYDHKNKKPTFLKGAGIEYLIEVDREIYQKYFESLTFFLGYKWIPKGYSWIFPMNNNQLKVGAAWLNCSHKIIARTQPLKDYIQLILKDYLNLDSYKIVDIHGSILEYSVGLSDRYYQDNVIAIGDAVSTVNFLGGEGIRHGMKGAEIAARYIQDYLLKKIDNFEDYQKEMHQFFAFKWNISDQISRRVYLEYSDEKIDRRVALLKYLTTEDLTDILFNYNFARATQIFKRYSLKKISLWFDNLKTSFLDRLFSKT
jgi:digeranylgeranylglycerophospholipid reductase